jgi:serine/threonine protein phosphatase 1
MDAHAKRTGSMIVSHKMLARQSIDPEEAIFAIGDVHGLADAFYAAMRVANRTRTPPGLRRRLVLLGDIIDRGKDSIGCIDLALSAPSIAGVQEVTSLMGNHEMMLAIALQGSHGQKQASILHMWLDNGGKEFLAEIGLKPGVTRKELRRALGSTRIDFITSMKPFHHSGEVTFVHAGFDPVMEEIPDQCLAWDVTKDALSIESHAMWVGDSFLDKIGKGCHGGSLICHGHSPGDTYRRNAYARRRNIDAPPELADAPLTVRDFDRINLDAGAPSKKAVRIALFVGNEITLHHVTV